MIFCKTIIRNYWEKNNALFVNLKVLSIQCKFIFDKQIAIKGVMSVTLVYTAVMYIYI